MATKTVKTVDVQLLNAARERPKTYKLDNPKEGLTRAEISAAFSPALTNSWLLASNGSPALYLGDTILNTSIKVSLDGEDFYVTPNSLTLKGTTPQTLTVTGAQIQGYNIKNIQVNGEGFDSKRINVIISDNALTATVTVNNTGRYKGTFDLILIIRGEPVTIPATLT